MGGLLTADGGHAPVRVDYELTALGAGLPVAVKAVKVWAEIHMDEIEAARSAYDAAPLQ